MKHMIAAVIFTTFCQTSIAGCWWNCNKSKSPEPTQSKSVPAFDEKISEKEVRATFDFATQELVTLEALIREGEQNPEKSRIALEKAMRLTDTIKVKTGVNPKIKITQSIPVDFKFTPNELSSDFANLNLQKRDLVALAVGKTFYGQFFDLLNLSKRAHLLYVKAALLVIRESNKEKNIDQLNDNDKKSLISELIAVYQTPIFLFDGNELGIPFLVFDNDVTTAGHVDWFNREINTFVEMEKELFPSGFQTLNRALSEQKTKIVNSIPKPKPILQRTICINSLYRTVTTTGKVCRNRVLYSFDEDGTGYAREKVDSFSKNLCDIILKSNPITNDQSEVLSCLNRILLTETKNVECFEEILSIGKTSLSRCIN